MSVSSLRLLGKLISVVSFSVLTTVASAQSSAEVSLQSLDKSVMLTGELVGIVNDQYKLQTIAGLILIDLDSVDCVGDACPEAGANFEAGAEVSLASADGAINVVGALVDIDDGHYVVENAALGTLRINIETVRCSGPGCPAGDAFSSNATVVNTIEGASDSAELTSTTSTTNAEVETTIAAEQQQALRQFQADAIIAAGEKSRQLAKERLEAESAALEEASTAAPTPRPPAPPKPAPEVNTNSKTTDPVKSKVTFAGSDTVGLGLLPYLLEDFANTLSASADTDILSETETFVRYVGENETEVSSIYVNSTGSGDATDALETKSAVFGMTSRPIKDEEAQRLRAAGAGNLRNSTYETVIAVDSLAVVTHPSNPVKAISIVDLGRIYLGEIDNWSQVGGRDAPITVLSRDDGSSTRGVFEKAIFNGVEPTLAERVTYPGGDNPEMAAAIKLDPLAIGYVGFAYSDGLNRLDLTSECGIQSRATSFAVKTEEYPLGRRLYLYNRPDNMNREAERFLEYVLSPDADDAIAKSNFVNFAVERTQQTQSRFDRLYDGLSEEPELRLADQMNNVLPKWDRLSTTIRFRTGSFRLGKKELNDINRLISTLSELPYGTRIAVVGFTDNVGTFEDNLSLSQRRAESVANSIRAIAGDRISNVQIETRSYSELSPSVCNTYAGGRSINRRVEIWVSN